MYNIVMTFSWPLNWNSPTYLHCIKSVYKNHFTLNLKQYFLLKKEETFFQVPENKFFSHKIKCKWNLIPTLTILHQRQENKFYLQFYVYPMWP